MDLSQSELIKSRTKKIGVAVIRLVDSLPQKPAAWVVAKQIVRSATAIGSNYRAVCRAKSTADFINKLKIVEEEADETIYWLEIMHESGMISENLTAPIVEETRQILAIVIASIKTSRARQLTS